MITESTKPVLNITMLVKKNLIIIIVKIQDFWIIFNVLDGGAKFEKLGPMPGGKQGGEGRAQMKNKVTMLELRNADTDGNVELR